MSLRVSRYCHMWAIVERPSHLWGRIFPGFKERQRHTNKRSAVDCFTALILHFVSLLGAL